MKRTHYFAASIIIATSLTACQRETNTVVGTTPATPATPATAPGPAATPSQPNVVSTTVDHTQSMERLQQAAQRLRDSIQALAQQPAGPQRNQAIQEAHEALKTTNQAMIQLPPDMRVEGVSTTTSAGASGTTATIGSQPDSPQAMEALQKAAQQLRESIQSMVQEPAGERRNQAIKAAHKALYDTNQAMIQLPPGMTAGK